MTRKSIMLILGTCLALLLGGLSLALATEKEPVVGYNAGNVPFSAPLTSEDRAYLGLAQSGPFTLKDIKASYVLVESFNTTCPHCMHQAPVLNRLFELVQKDAQLKDTLKFLAAGQGNDENAVKMWKTFHKIPFPVVPDKESKLGKALNFTPYPVTVVLDKTGKVVWVHIGAFESAEEALKEIKKVIR